MQAKHNKKPTAKRLGEKNKTKTESKKPTAKRLGV